jgi:4-hydroxy-3-methylbut-2-enyl diphosphate reductase
MIMIQQDTQKILKKYILLGNTLDDGTHVLSSICGRFQEDTTLVKFCGSHDIVIFASSPESSNGKLLFHQCTAINVKSFFVTDVKDVKSEWFKGVSSVGITGATSTPRWLLEEIAVYIKNILLNS